jgi:hypothetical protein
MEMLVDRFISDDDSTVSRILVDGRFVCFGLEDEYREEKLPKETRIPSGLYKVSLRTEGGFHERYSRRYGTWHRGMLHVLNVPEFKYILIHTGNTQDQTDGCLLVGDSAITTAGDMRVNLSRVAYQKLYPLVVDAAGNDDLQIIYQDNDI